MNDDGAPCIPIELHLFTTQGIEGFEATVTWTTSNVTLKEAFLTVLRVTDMDRHLREDGVILLVPIADDA
jgi:hypothetical protein